MTSIVISEIPADLDAAELTELTGLPCTLTPHPSNGSALADFDGDVTPAMFDAIVARSRMTRAEADVRKAARSALTTNQDWIDNVYPALVSGAQTIIDDTTASTRERQLAQGVRALANQLRDVTTQNNAVIRLVVRAIA